MFASIPTPIDFSRMELQLEEILDRRLVKKGNAAHLQVLIKWGSLPAEMATWEDYEVLRVCFPNASTWGRAESQVGCTMTAVTTEGEGKSKASSDAKKAGHNRREK